ncbi:MAG: AAA family ATPase [Promethearchaeota archaeon]
MSIYEILEIRKTQIITPNQIIFIPKTLQKNQYILPLDSKNFDDVIGGGFNSRKKYLVFGPNKTGKTQLCHQLCIQAYKHLNKILGLKNVKFIYYFDTENTFRPERITELVTPSKLEINQVLESVLVSKIMSNSAFLLSLKDFENAIKRNRGGVLIIDTINNHFRSELANNNISFSKARKTFLKILNKVDELTNKYNLITIATSQVTPNFSKTAIIRELPVGNQFLNHYFSEYVYLSKKEREMNYVQLVNSLNLSEKKILYKITSKGIQDYKI